MKKRWIVYLSSSLLVAACNTVEPVHTVDWYASHEVERTAVVNKCQNDPGELANAPNCVNASQAEHQAKERYSSAKLIVQVLAGKVEVFALDNGALPKTLDELVTRPPDGNRWMGPYAKSQDLVDPYGHLFVYKMPGEHGDFDIIFLGADGRAGGEGMNKDYGNWE
jgi:type II secretion system protein G